MLLSSVNYTFANEVTYDYLKNLAKEMITPTELDLSNHRVREEIYKKDNEITKKFNTLSKEDKQKLLKFMNWDKVRYQIRSFWYCHYERFPDRIEYKQPIWV